VFKIGLQNDITHSYRVHIKPKALITTSNF